MTPAPLDPSESGDRDAFFQWLNGGEPQPPEREASAIDGLDEEDEEQLLLKALQRALGDTHVLCPKCDQLCEEHGHLVKIRDRVMLRALGLTQKLQEGLNLYLQQRNWGLSEPDQLVERIYQLWDELCVLGQAAEPQEWLELAGGEDEFEDPAADLDGD